ncbi:MAG: peptidoglycan-binding protein [Candidatus Pacebacteria bacterium]|nr:peptidoglycan-binding protein [Candidatus Paceibacterota bacterium]MBP9840015.1 peptidoglycan-binding protein [Candidatus Paceibacterota bacterium]
MSITNTNAVAKVAAVVAGLGLVAMSFASFAVPARAATADDLAAQIAALQAQLAALSGGSSASVTFTRDLTIGSTGADVTALQTWLMGKGFSIPAGATGYFGAQTQSALAAYQASVGIMPAAGYFGPITRAKVGGSVSMPDGDDDDNGGDLEGGAGSVDSYELMASLNDEEVGEDEEDAEVAGLEIEADDGSDLEITAVRVVFDESDDAAEDGSDNVHDDFEDYASEVSVWFDGEEVARVDADEFNDDNDWTKTISLDDAIVEAGETAELVVAVTGGSNLDDGQYDDVWDADFTQVRFMDADGATVSEDPATGIREFTFVSFASAADIELKISEDDDAINDSRSIGIDATDDTDGEEVLSFTLEAEGDSDITIDSFVVSVTSTEATGNDPDDLISALTLVVDGEEVATESLSTSDTDNSMESIEFDDLEWVIGAGETVEVVITADFFSEADSLDAGDTVSFSLGETESDAWDVEDDAGEDLADADITGSANSGAFDLRSTGIEVEFVSASETVTEVDSTDNDTGTFEIAFNVTAVGDKVYVARTSAATTATDITNTTLTTGTDGGGILYRVTDSDTATTDDLSDDVNLTGGDGDEETNTIEILEDETAEVTVTIFQINNTAEDDGIYRASIEAIGWATSDTTTFNVYDFELDDFETGVISLN